MARTTSKQTATVGTESFIFSIGYKDVHAYIRTLRGNVQFMKTKGSNKDLEIIARDEAIIARYDAAI